MPCHPARARQLLKQGKAKKQFTNQICYLKLLDREDGEVQKVACGIDPGSKREAFTVKSSSRTFINILSETNGDLIKKKLETRRNMRKDRRKRKTPCRKNKFYRNKNGSKIPPSTRARWNAKLRIINMLRKIYPISNYVVEDIVARTIKGKKQWNNLFSPLQTGKNYFYSEIKKLGKLFLKKGYETSLLRDKLGLYKNKKDKLADKFECHNVDSWVLANSIFNIQTKLDNILIYKFSPMTIYRRQLHYFQPCAKGYRPRYGGTVSFSIPRRTICKYKNSYYTIGGYRFDGKTKFISIHELKNNHRKSRDIKLLNVELFKYVQRWIVTKC